ncbi:hypothetical protein AV530_008803 [Patagioenas fasciata monilis]|uniref:Ig-like domain-containing protein n=1 Tax=Patagioenas fasciata monilis TaxID=372326 RepID=A0A1V4JF17_PATFA|nr:hypothetical protein AV530_008803 [Patagioenas fasciata monilis]
MQPAARRHLCNAYGAGLRFLLPLCCIKTTENELHASSTWCHLIAGKTGVPLWERARSSPEDKGSSAPVKSEILKKKHENLITYVCLIEKFYPEVIRVTWTDGEKEITDNVGKGDAWKPAEEEEYSIGSWLTVPAENKNKNYYCKFEHESQQRSLPTKDSTETSQEEDCSTYPGNGTVFNRDHLMHRTAYLVYIVLLLKSSMYYLIVLFFIYRMWASTKHQGKKA